MGAKNANTSTALGRTKWPHHTNLDWKGSGFPARTAEVHPWALISLLPANTIWDGCFPARKWLDFRLPHFERHQFCWDFAWQKASLKTQSNIINYSPRNSCITVLSPQKVSIEAVFLNPPCKRRKMSTTRITNWKPWGVLASRISLWVGLSPFSVMVAAMKV